LLNSIKFAFTSQATGRKGYLEAAGFSMSEYPYHRVLDCIVKTSEKLFYVMKQSNK